MGNIREDYRSEWVSDYRCARRWLDARTVLARLDGEEALGKTQDVSLGGMKLELSGLQPQVGRRLALAVVFADRILDLEATVLYATDSGRNYSMGLAFDHPLNQQSAKFLLERYPPAMVDARLDLSEGV